MNKPDHKRSLIKKYIIYPRFQYKLIGYLNIIMATGFITITLSIYFAFNRLKDIGMKANLPADHIFFRFLDQQLADLFFPNITLAVLFTFIIANMVSLKLTQKLAGPVLRLRGYFKDLTAENFKAGNRLKFRENDFFSEVPDQINESLDKIVK